MKNYRLGKKLDKYILEPRNPNYNFELACEYFTIKQYASALSYYLRCAELSNNKDLVYESLLCSWDCMSQVGRRTIFEKGQLQQALSQSPNRPEGYYHLCHWLECNGSNSFNSNEELFQEIYLFACIGIENIKNNKEFKYFNRYPGYYGLMFYKAFSAWHIGKLEESEDIYLDLHRNHELDDKFKQCVYNNIKNLNIEPRINNTTKNVGKYMLEEGGRGKKIIKKESKKSTKMEKEIGKEKQIKKWNVNDLNKDSEWGIIETNQFKISTEQKKRVWIIDDFYEDPNAIREFALSQYYFDDEGYLGMRTRKQFMIKGVKEKFEEIMGAKITKWNDYGMNGRFQSTIAGTSTVYHCDAQQWAGMIYLTPDAPFSSGTKIMANKKSRIYHNGQSDNIFDFFPNQETFVDGTLFEDVDVIGNVYNRLVIFDAQSIHCAGDYFGWDIASGRLWQMFFFDADINK